jgi:hypothetical protein
MGMINTIFWSYIAVSLLFYPYCLYGYFMRGMRLKKILNEKWLAQYLSDPIIYEKMKQGIDKKTGKINFSFFSIAMVFALGFCFQWPSLPFRKTLPWQQPFQ